MRQDRDNGISNWDVPGTPELQGNAAKAISQRGKLESLYSEFPQLEQVETSGRHRLKARKTVLKLVPTAKVGAEIGVFTGMFSTVLASVTRPAKLFLVDPWEKLHGETFPNWGAYTGNVRLPTRAARLAAQARASEFTCTTEIVHGFLHDWRLPKKSAFLDWVYLDANHTYDAVINDLQLLEHTLRKDGLILGDDCWIWKEGHASQVYQAVRDFCQQNDFSIIFLDACGQWAIRRSSEIKMGKP